MSGPRLDRRVLSRAQPAALMRLAEYMKLPPTRSFRVLIEKLERKLDSEDQNRAA